MRHSTICEVCLRSRDVLCPACEEKLNRGEISKLELEVCRFLKSLEEKFKVLRNARIVKVFHSEKQIIIVTRSGDAPKVIGKNGSIAKLISKEFGKPVKVIEECETVSEFANNFVYPASVEGVNIVYGKDGRVSKYRIRISRSQYRKIDVALLEEAVKCVFGKEAESVIV